MSKSDGDDGDPASGSAPRVRKGQPIAPLTEDAFRARFRERFADPAFDDLGKELASLEEAAWSGYHEYRKSPRTAPAGPGAADPDYEVAVDWLHTRQRLKTTQERHDDPASPSRVLIVCASARNDQTCPGEMSKTYRLASIASELVSAAPGFEAELLDLSRLTAEPLRVIYPCKGCVSTAMPLCHWPCSCYPNYALGQVNDWMNEIYPMWVAAHGVMIVTPVHWYQAPSVLKLMIDRLVCADGGNPDITSTSGKDPEKAKALELAGWDYPRHLAGRAFAVVVHGDAAGVGTLSRSLAAWLADMSLVPAAPSATLGRYIDYYGPYATSHDALDRDTALQEEVRNAARALLTTVSKLRSGEYVPSDSGLQDPRPK